jgi:hypothetical protein
VTCIDTLDPPGGVAKLLDAFAFMFVLKSNTSC